MDRNTKKVILTCDPNKTRRRETWTEQRGRQRKSERKIKRNINGSQTMEPSSKGTAEENNEIKQVSL